MRYIHGIVCGEWDDHTIPSFFRFLAMHACYRRWFYLWKLPQHHPGLFAAMVIVGVISEYSAASRPEFRHPPPSPLGCFYRHNISSLLFLPKHSLPPSYTMIRGFKQARAAVKVRTTTFPTQNGPWGRPQQLLRGNRALGNTGADFCRIDGVNSPSRPFLSRRGTSPSTSTSLSSF